jgi:hypothetical protein
MHELVMTSPGTSMNGKVDWDERLGQWVAAAAAAEVVARQSTLPAN